MNHYLFVLGTAFELAHQELVSHLRKSEISFTTIHENAPLVILSTENTLDLTKLMFTLGGTIKIARLVLTTPDFDTDHVIQKIVSGEEKTSIDFGISTYTKQKFSIPQFVRSLKTAYEEKGMHARFVLPKEGTQLSSVVVKKQELTEFILVDQDTPGWFVFETSVVQDSDDWSKRDYSRPYADAKAGMLPPKVARMMVNCALAEIPESSEKSLLFDPFCGMGTVLAEARVLGFTVLGSDILPEVVKKAQKNVEWLEKTYTLEQKSTFLVADAVHVGDQVKENYVNAIVTEPFMGTPFEKRGDLLMQKGKVVTRKTVENTLRGLEKLFIGAFKEWQKILKAGGVVVMVLPSIEFQRVNYTVKKLIDKAPELGYTNVRGPLEYSRPQAVVKRNIYIFKKR